MLSSHAARTFRRMPDRRPPTTDAEFRVVHGPWPRWSMHVSLIKLGASAAAVVLACVLTAIGVMAVLGVFR